MVRWSLSVCVCAVLVCFAASQDWSFQEPDKWKETYPQCGGDQQSPIDLEDEELERKSSTTEELKEAGTRYEHFYYGRNASGTFFFTGFSLQMNFTQAGSRGTPAFLVTENGNTAEYYLETLSFLQAQHERNATKNGTELQLLHRNSEGKIVILVYMIMECIGKEKSPPLLLKMLNSWDPETTVHLGAFRASDILARKEILNRQRINNSRRRFHIGPVCDVIKYTGSLVTPPCTENVTYFVYVESLCISRNKLKKLKDAMRESGNEVGYRPTQPVNGRIREQITC